MTNHSGHHRLTDSPARGQALLRVLRTRVVPSFLMVAPVGDPQWRICQKCQHSATSVYAGKIGCVRCHTVIA